MLIIFMKIQVDNSKDTYLKKSHLYQRFNEV